MNDYLAHSAITQALDCEWEKAIDSNLEILKGEKENTDALNRLAKAYVETGQVKKARDIYRKVLEIDPLNTIAGKCLKRMSQCKKVLKGKTTGGFDVSAFIEQPGITKIITLINPGKEEVLAALSCGEKVVINLQGRFMSIKSSDGQYIGRLPDITSAKVKRNYQEVFAVIRSIEGKSVKIILTSHSKNQ